MESLLGIIGGSGLYNIPALKNRSWRRSPSSFGDPSDELLFGEINERPVVFLPRHGRGHRIPPGRINYRANMDALKRVGVTDIVSIGAVGSLKEELKPGMFVLVDQLIDHTGSSRDSSFFTEAGLVVHVSMAHPICARLMGQLNEAAGSANIPIVCGGTGVVINGPQFSTVAESHLYRSWGCSVIGMTALPEAKLAREAEICYATVAMVTDYDCWHPEHDAVSVESVLQVFQQNIDKAQELTRLTATHVGSDADCACRRSLDHAVLTAPEARDPDVLQRLTAVAGRVLNHG